MASEVLAEIKEKFEGEWKVDRSECFEDFLREVGMFLSIYILNINRSINILSIIILVCYSRVHVCIFFV